MDANTITETREGHKVAASRGMCESPGRSRRPQRSITNLELWVTPSALILSQ